MEDEKKQIMFINTEGFYKIMWQLQAEIVQFWNLSIPETYDRVKQLFVHVHAHLKEDKVKQLLKVDDSKKYFIPKLQEIGKIVYDPAAEKYTGHARIKKIKNHRIASDMLLQVYMELKQLIKESGLEVFYGTSQDVIIRSKQNANLNKVFGRH